MVWCSWILRTWVFVSSRGKGCEAIVVAFNLLQQLLAHELKCFCPSFFALSVFRCAFHGSSPVLHATCHLSSRADFKLRQVPAINWISKYKLRQWSLGHSSSFSASMNSSSSFWMLAPGMTKKGIPAYGMIYYIAVPLFQQGTTKHIGYWIWVGNCELSTKMNAYKAAPTWAESQVVGRWRILVFSLRGLQLKRIEIWWKLRKKKKKKKKTFINIRLGLESPVLNMFVHCTYIDLEIVRIQQSTQFYAA